MPRILGVDIPNNKRVEYALRYIYGIGPTRATEIVNALGLDPALRSDKLTEELKFFYLSLQITNAGEGVEKKGTFLHC